MFCRAIAYNVKEKEYSALTNEVAKGLVRLGGFVTKYQQFVYDTSDTQQSLNSPVKIRYFSFKLTALATYISKLMFRASGKEIPTK